jgi:2-oxoglutarate ferredoxin oxidoreductase subunit alpha
VRELINGSEAIARGAIAAGCTFFAGYPITPASVILVYMTRELPKVGGIAIQAEDEIGSMGLCIGAAMAGAKAMTATSGPGISLFSEHIGLAIMSEVPLVIVDCQRMGPATGGATTGAQGDVQFLRWGTSGGYPVIVLSPSNVPECYELTIRAFNLAEQFRCPVFLATDKDTVLTSVTVDLDAYPAVPVYERPLAPATGDFTPYRFDPPDTVTPMSLLGGPHRVRFTGSSHDEHGYLVKDPATAGRLNRHLADKIDAHADEIALVRADIQPGAETLVISYGITARSVEEAVETARRQGRALSGLTLLTLWPVPARALRAMMAGVRRVVVAELNLDQYRREIERLAPDDVEVVGVHRVDGELITPEEILTKCQ